MEPPPPMFPIHQNSKKRVFMDLDDVIEIPPPVSRINKQSKAKEKVIFHEVIDVDKDENNADVMILDEKVDTKNKGKAKQNTYDNCVLPQEFSCDHLLSPCESSAPASNKIVDLDGLVSDLLFDDDDEYWGLYNPDDMMDSDDYPSLSTHFDVDEYASLQAHFDNVGIPPGVEAPIPWLPDSGISKKSVPETGSFNAMGQVQFKPVGSLLSKPTSESNSSFQVPIRSLIHPPGMDNHSCLPLPQIAQSKKKSTALQHVGRAGSLLSEKMKTASSSSINNFSPINLVHDTTIPHVVEPSYPVHYSNYAPLTVNHLGGPTNLFHSSSTPFVSNNPPLACPSLSWFASKLKIKATNNTSTLSTHDSFHHVPNLAENVARTPKNVNEDDILSKFQNFKQFDTVEDHADHHYSSQGSSGKQPPKAWAKRIQEEWRILEKDLPDTIFVRVYETRMDLLRAVIVGAEGTPYHDGIFFFDVYFPSRYPNVPPEVYYHSGGLRLNPNLYSNGKVCLSLLGTWHGNQNERWLPGVSTMLQVLVSIQALILNQKPFFNEPGYERLSGLPNGEMQSQQYNENTFILSLRTMVYTMRRPPKHFEDFVMGHFHKSARDILVACKAYMEGAQVGCLVKGGVQDVDEGDKSCSKNFKDSLPGCVSMLLNEFLHIGVKGCEEFQTLAKADDDLVGNTLNAI